MQLTHKRSIYKEWWLLMINVLEHINELREQKNWIEYQLAERSGLTQSTISSWYRNAASWISEHLLII